MHLLIAAALFLPVSTPVCPGPSVPPGPTAPTASPSPSSDTLLVRLYDEGIPFDDFLADVSPEARPDTWRANHERGVADPGLLARARAVGGSWRVLAVALDGCSDSVHTLPYLAALADALPALELRIVDPQRGREVMESHRTPDDRAATPTFVLLDAQGREAGCWIERPTPLQAFMVNRSDGRGGMEKFRMKMAWYEADAGWTTVREFVEVLEGAAAGTPVCRRPVSPDAPYPGAGPDGRPVASGGLE